MSRASAASVLAPPSIAPFRFGALPVDVARAADKITQKGRRKADQSVGAMSVAANANGIDVTADADGLTSSATYPDGFRWVQTVTTNDPSDTPVGAPLLATPLTYVDPRPNDDSKPFYWTDAEETAQPGHFSDGPGRPAHPTGTIVWDAVLSIAGVDGTDVKRFDSVTYGFSIDSAGTVTVNHPRSPGSVGDHLGALGSEFSGWTFT